MDQRPLTRLSFRDFSIGILTSWWGKVIASIITFGAIFTVYDKVDSYMDKLAVKAEVNSKFDKQEILIAGALEKFNAAQEKKMNISDVNTQIQILKIKLERLSDKREEIKKELKKNPKDQEQTEKLNDVNKKIDKLEKEIDDAENRQLQILKAK